MARLTCFVFPPLAGGGWRPPQKGDMTLNLGRGGGQHQDDHRGHHHMGNLELTKRRVYFILLSFSEIILHSEQDQKIIV